MSTYGPVNLPSFISNDADFRTWANGIHTMLSTLGLVQTADTGQINLTTVTRPSASSYGGYEIWRFADAAQATVPIFFKLEYGVGNPQDRPNLRCSWGSGSNGSGTLSNASSTQNVSSNASTSAGNTNPTFGAAGAGYLSFVTNHDASSNGRAICFGIERLRDSSGAVTTDGYYAVIAGSGGNGTLYDAGAASFSTHSGGYVPGLAGKSPSGGNAAFSQGRVFLGQPRFLLMFGRVILADLAALATVVVTTLGTTHTYIGVFTQGSAIDNGSSTMTDSHAMIWE